MVTVESNSTVCGAAEPELSVLKNTAHVGLPGGGSPKKCTLQVLKGCFRPPVGTKFSWVLVFVCALLKKI